MSDLGSKMAAEPGQQDGSEAMGGRTGTLGSPPANQRAQPPLASLPSYCPGSVAILLLIETMHWHLVASG